MISWKGVLYITIVKYAITISRLFLQIIDCTYHLISKCIESKSSVKNSHHKPRFINFFALILIQSILLCNNYIIAHMYHLPMRKFGLSLNRKICILFQMKEKKNLIFLIWRWTCLHNGKGHTMTTQAIVGIVIDVLFSFFFNWTALWAKWYTPESKQSGAK